MSLGEGEENLQRFRDGGCVFWCVIHVKNCQQFGNYSKSSQFWS